MGWGWSMLHRPPFPSQPLKTTSKKLSQGGCPLPSTPKGGGLAPARSRPLFALLRRPRWAFAAPGAGAGRGSGNRAGFEPLPSTVFALLLYWLSPEAALRRAK